MIREEDALDYHSCPPAGKISVVPTKPCITQRDLSLAYTPGVAEPCLAIQRDPDLAYKYTSKANLVAVITNGTAVLGLGNIGPAAGKPVMEGKGILFDWRQLKLPAVSVLKIIRSITTTRTEERKKKLEGRK